MRVSGRGQVTIPKAVRHSLGIVPGTEIQFDRTEDGTVTLTRTDGKRWRSHFARYRGHAGVGMTTDELMTLTRGTE